MSAQNQYTIDDIIAALQDFIYYLAHTRCTSDTLLMGFDDIVGELLLELVKTFMYYKDKNLTKGQMLAVIRKTLDNRIGELIYRYFKTHRVVGNNYIPIEQLAEMEDEDDDTLYHPSASSIDIHLEVFPTAETILISKQGVLQLRSMLSPAAIKVVDAILDGHPMVAEQVRLSIDRAAFVYKSGGTVRIEAWHLADGLAMDVNDIKRAFVEIRKAYVEAFHG